MSLGLHRPLILSQVGMALIIIPLSVVLIPRLGPPGAALAATAGFVLAFVVPGLVLRGRILAGLRPGGSPTGTGAEATTLSSDPVPTNI